MALRTLRAATAVLALLLLSLLLGAAPVRAEPPPQLYGQVSDRADVGLSSEVRRALERLYADKSIRLFVVFIDTFDGTDSAQWAFETRERSGLSSNDVLFVYAVDDGWYQYSADGSFHLSAFQLSEDELDDLFTREVEPRLWRGDWSGAVVALADGLRGGGIGVSTIVVWVVGGVLFVVYLLSQGLGDRPQAPRSPGSGRAEDDYARQIEMRKYDRSKYADVDYKPPGLL